MPIGLWEIKQTADGSPTMSFIQPGQGGAERMHNEHGACHETLHVYGRLVDEPRIAHLPHRYLSVGMGLGYVEMMIVAHLLQKKIKRDELWIQSHEVDKALKQAMREWCHFPEKFSSMGHDHLGHVIQGAATSMAREFDLSSLQIAKCLEHLESHHRWVVKEGIERPQKDENLFHRISFDLFSQKSNPKLWEPEFLETFLDTFAAPQCAFATYACRGSLVRTLQKKGFQVQRVPGFGKKRESIFAIREGDKPGG